MNVVSWFEIPVRDLARAKSFYAKVLGKELMDMPAPFPGRTMAAFPWVPEAPHAAGALVQQEGLSPQQDGTMVFFQVDDVATPLGRVPASGGRVLAEKMAIGEHGFIGLALDSEGNRIGFASRM